MERPKTFMEKIALGWETAKLIGTGNFDAARLLATGELWTHIERFESLEPDHIGVGEDPPLCRNCLYALCRPQKVDVQSDLVDISKCFDRIKASAKLGCYLCSMMYYGDWSLRSAHHSDLTLKQKLSDINPRPDLFFCKLAQREEGTKTFHVEATAAYSENLGQLWEFKNIVLIPIEGKSQRLYLRRPYTLSLHLTEVEDQVFRVLPSANTADSIAQQTLSWIEECQASHENCHLIQPPSTTWKPTRLIYAGQPDVGLRPRLCLSSDLPADTRYVTLSHCWGSINIFRLLSTNIESLLKELPLSELTQVFCDAIDLACRLGVSYIWIDSLCIVQDSVQDWQRESALMGNVYRCSWCNIAATGFENGLAGIYVQRNLARLNRITVKLDVRVPDEEEGTKTYNGRFFCMENFWDVDVSNAPLNQRAWVYQERLLSPRVLHLGSNQAFWECADAEACEAFPQGIPAALSSGFKVDTINVLRSSLLNKHPETWPPGRSSERNELEEESEMLELWWQVVRTYNRGALTKYEDKLIAMAGIAKEMQVVLKDKYIAGLWGKHLLHHLTWHTTISPGGDEVFDWGKSSRPPYYQAPSWSWASINRCVENMVNFDARPLATILDHSVSVDGPSEFGRVIDGYIRIRGQLTQVTFRASDKVLRRKWDELDIAHQVVLRTKSPRQTIILPTLLPDIWVPVPSVVDDGVACYPIRDAIGSRSFYLLPTCETESGWTGILLQRTESKVRGQYRRLGAFVVLKEDEKSFAAFQSHVPRLDDQDYENSDEGGFSITII